MLPTRGLLKHPLTWGCDRTSTNCDRISLFYRILGDRLQKFCLRSHIHQKATLRLCTPQLTGAATKLTGAATELMGAATKLMAVATELMAVATKLMGAATKLMGAATELMGAATELMGAATELMAVATELIGAYKYQYLVIKLRKITVINQKL